MNTPRIITVCNHKGGSGKTTTVINLGAALMKKGNRVLLIDVDAQANTTIGLGIEPNDLDTTIYEVFFENKPIEKAIIKTKSGIDIVPSSAHMISAEEKLTGKSNNILKNILENKINGYDYVLIDTPPALGHVTLNALAASKEMIVPVQTHYFALRGLATIAETVKLVQKSVNKDLRLTGVLLTMYDSRTNLSKEVRKDVENYFKGTVFNTVIPTNVKLAQVTSAGKTIYEKFPASSGAIAYEKLSNEVTRRSKA